MSILKTLSVDNAEYEIKFMTGTNDCYLNVEVFSLVGTRDDGLKLYERRNGDNGMNTTSDLEDSKRILKGYIKWDGCSDIYFFPDEDGSSHFCGKQTATHIGVILGVVYDMGKDIMGPRVVHDEKMYDGK